MSFLNLALLPGLLLVAGIPLLIHLLNLRYPRLFEFSSVKRLRETIAQRSRIFRWRHLLLLLIRTLLLVLLLLAFLKPLLPRFGSSAEPHAGRAVVLIIDHSLSMEYRAGGIGGRQRAQNEADKILATLGANDLANVIVAGQTPKACFFELSPRLDEARHFVMGIASGLGRADFSQANVLAARLLKDGKRPEIYYLSDFQRRSWANVDFTALPPETRTFFVDCAPPNRGNRAILGATISQSQVIAGDTVTLEVEVGNFRDQPMDEPVQVVLDGRTSFEKEVNVPPWSTAKVTLPVPPGGPGLHQCEIRLAPDDLPEDDHFFLTIPVMEKEGILVVSDTPEPDRDAVHFLETALNPYEGQAGSLRPEHLKTAELTNAKLALVRKVFFTRAGPLSDATAKLVAEFIFHGGGAVYFLDGDNDPANLAAIERGMGSSRMPLKLGARRVPKNIGSGAEQIIRGDFKSRYLRLFRGELRQNLALLEFYDLYDAAGTGSGNILLTYADETPAMAALNHGLGTLLLMNFSVSEFSSNLARQRIFPAWMQEIVKNLASEEAPASSTIIGDAVNDEVWKRELQGSGLRKPSGEPADARVEAMGERAGLSFVPEELGFYTVREGRLLHSYAVNPPPEESDLRPIDRALLPERVGENGMNGYFVQGHEDFQDLILGKPIFHWFILAAAALLLAETALQFFVQRSQARPAMKMEWRQLLCADRLGARKSGAPDPARPPYTIDSDRIIFCSAFRRLQDKTQVFPLADNDFVRTRLTHSLEVASVGRSLGARVGAEIVKRHGLAPDYHASDFGAIASAAALAHDLGNPPFGHSGEDAIQHWFLHSPVTARIKPELTALQRADVEKFEGNAQGFRVIARLQMPDNPGLRLTCATLAAFSKYPRESLLPPELNRGVSLKKFGFFQSERALFKEVAAKTGLLARSENAACWHRHPLAFLVEAADDICYRLVDFEDGFRLKHLQYAQVFEAFLAVSGDEKDRDRAARMRDENERIAFLRAKAIGAAIEQTAEAFLQNEESILRGEFDQELLELIPSGAALRAIKDVSKRTIYSTVRGVEIEVAGYEVLGGLLNVFFGALEDVARSGSKASMRSRKLLRLAPAQFLGPEGRPDQAPDLRLMKVLDFVSGMTDSYAVSLYKKVRGISLPGA